MSVTCWLGILKHEGHEVFHEDHQGFKYFFVYFVQSFVIFVFRRENLRHYNLLMRIGLRKIWRDLWQHRGRTLMAVPAAKVFVNTLGNILQFPFDYRYLLCGKWLWLGISESCGDI